MDSSGDEVQNINRKLYADIKCSEELNSSEENSQ